ncbi:MAG TPA: ATP-binding cassette domain-containing protein [Geminicoccaceae bacterium]|nr:ATP-binding cassette domain-containing protein [Geminicoccaceae bacterium]
MTPAPIISARNLRKTYGTFEAVRGIDFDVAPASCTGLLGPNGAGKTSTMRMIMGLASVTAGELRVFGVPVDRITRKEKARIGLVPQDNNLDPDLSIRQNLEVYGDYFGLPRAAVAERVPRLLAFMQLTERGGSQVMQLSGGMKRRLVIARALISDPELVILDEPTTGLDPQARVLIWRQLLELKRQGRTLLLTTHYMDEAQRLCDRIVVIDGGTVLDEGSPAELIGRHVKGHVYELPKPLPAGFDEAGLDREDIGDAVLYYVETPDEMRARLPRGTADYLHRPSNLEDVFLRLTGRKLREP